MDITKRERDELRRLTKKFKKSGESFSSGKTAKALLKRMAQLGLTAREMGGWLKITPGSATAFLGRHGITVPRPQYYVFSKEQDDHIRRYCKMPKPDRATSDRLGRELVEIIRSVRKKDGNKNPVNFQKIITHARSRLDIRWNPGYRPGDGNGAENELKLFFQKLKPLLISHRMVRNQMVAKELGTSKDLSRGRLAKLVENGDLVSVRDENDQAWYFLNRGGFYRKDELFKLVPAIERERIMSALESGNQTVRQLSEKLFDDPRGTRGAHFLEIFFKDCASHGLLALLENGRYSIEEAFLTKLESLLSVVRRIRSSQVVKFLKMERSAVKTALADLVEQGKLIKLIDAREDRVDYEWYLANTPVFHTAPPKAKKIVPYTPIELFENLTPKSEIDRLTNAFESAPATLTISELALQLYGSEHRGRNYLATLLTHYINKGLLEASGDGIYEKSHVGKRHGFEPEVMNIFDHVRLENELLATEPIPFNSLDELSAIQKKDREKKTVAPFSLEDLLGKQGVKGSLSIRLVAETMIGNQDSDIDFVREAIARDVPYAGKPSLIMTSGLIQGSFYTKGVKKNLTLTEGIEKTKAQLHGAGLLLTEMETRSVGPCLVMMSDDDMRNAEADADLAQRGEGKTWRFGIKGDTLDAALQHRLAIDEFIRKLKIGYDKIGKYEYLLGRHLYNEEEVFRLLGRRRFEYVLILQILLARKNGIPYPKAYEKVVDVAALFGNQRGKRIVTPDSLIITRDGQEIFQAVHNSNFSDITMYQSPHRVLWAMTMGQGAMGKALPRLRVDCQQEMFQGHCEGGDFFITLPGSRNPDLQADFKMKQINMSPLDDKSRRRQRVARMITRPGVPDYEVLADGRVRIHFWNRTIADKVRSQVHNEPEEVAIALVTDEQTGSPTMAPEYVMKYLDFALYGAEKPATCLDHLGDAIQGSSIYRTLKSECRVTKLVDIPSQQDFWRFTHFPLIKQAPCLSEVRVVPGNHEYDNLGSSLEGANYLAFIERELQAYVEGLRSKGEKSPLELIEVADRSRWTKTPNPWRDAFKWPFASHTVAGFTIAMQHTWQLRGRHGGVSGTPIDQQRAWLRKMGSGASNIDVMLGGDKHTFWFGEEVDKLLIQLPAMATQSGLEVGLGVISQLMFCRLLVSNRQGITLEIIPWQFLRDYK